MFFVKIDQIACRRIMLGIGWLVGSELGLNPCSKNLTEFNAPLIERINFPNNTLHKDLMLIKSNKRAQTFGIYLVQEQRIGRTITPMDFLWHQFSNALF